MRFNLRKTAVRSWSLITASAISVLLSACSNVPTSQERLVIADRLAESRNWQSSIIVTDNFNLYSYQPKQPKTGPILSVYIEGDGLAWINTTTRSSDPTPLNPVALKLALKHPQGIAVYLARPCQYTGGTSGRNCSKSLWSDSRFSEEVVNATSEAIDKLKQEFDADRLQLIGFSGGGALATLIAARRQDVKKLITVAGNLDHRKWTEHHKVTPLRGSLNPADFKDNLINLEQVHVVGANDKVIPAKIAESFITGLPTTAKVMVIPAQDHSCCWDTIWQDLIENVGVAQ